MASTVTNEEATRVVPAFSPHIANVRSRLSTTTPDSAIESSYKYPNWWHQFWFWALLGWRLKKVVAKVWIDESLPRIPLGVSPIVVTVTVGGEGKPRFDDETCRWLSLLERNRKETQQ